MRVIRTEMYFAPETIEHIPDDLKLDNPGIAVAWFKSENQKIIDLRDVGGFRVAADSHEELINAFLSLSLQGVIGGADGELLNSRTVFNEHIINFVLTQPIIIEQSPPTGVPFRELVGKNAVIAIGTYIGLSIAGSHPLLMLVSVPEGIMLIGSAVGVSRALEKGMNKWVEKLFKKWLD